MKTLTEYNLYKPKMSCQCFRKTKGEEILNVIPMFTGSTTTLWSYFNFWENNNPIQIPFIIPPPFVFVEHKAPILALHRIHFMNVITIYLLLKYYIGLQCVHNVFSWNIGPVPLWIMVDAWRVEAEIDGIMANDSDLRHHHGLFDLRGYR